MIVTDRRYSLAAVKQVVFYEKIITVYVANTWQSLYLTN